jgi:nitrogen fixation protein FixH
MPQPDRPTRIDQTDAKAGTKEGVVRWVLAISVGLTVLAFAVIVLAGALSQDPVESQQNAQRRAEEQREQAQTGRQDLAEQGDLVRSNTTERAEETSDARATGVAPNE